MKNYYNMLSMPGVSPVGYRLLHFVRMNMIL